MKDQDEIILFDGVCNFCNRTIQFVLRHEKKPELKFASLQSETGRRLLKQYAVPQDKFGTLVYITGGKARTRSTAALMLTRKFRGLWPLLMIFLIIPPFIRNFFYDFIARNRYKWWGRTESCQLPLPGQRARFLDL